MIFNKFFRNVEKQLSITSEIEDSIIQDNDNDVLETSQLIHEKQLISMIKDNDVIFFSKQFEIIRSFVSFLNQSTFFFFFSKSIEWQMIFDFNQIQINNLMNIMSDMMNIKIKKVIDLQNDQFQIIMNRLDEQIERLHSRMYESAFSTSFALSTSFASFASFAHQDFERFNFQLANVWESITRNQEDRDFERLVDSKRSRLLFDMSDDEDSLALVALTTSKLRFEDVNFFDSNYQEKNKKIVNHFVFASVVNANKHMFYRDVYVFTNKLLDLVKQHDNETIENVIIVCFRSIALMWYSMKIDDFLRNLFRDAKLNIWCIALIDRFRTRSSIALIQLTIQFYFLNEIKQNITFRQWFQRMLHYVKVAKLNSIYNQLTLIWNRFHYILRRDLSKSKVFIIVQRFLEDIDVKIFI